MRLQTLLVVSACAVATIVLQGCATVKESYGPDGRKAFALNCSGTGRGWDKCLSAAGEACGAAGYDIIDRTSEDTAFAGSAAKKSVFESFAVKSSERAMLISCKKG